MHNPPMISGRRLALVVAAAALIGCGGANDPRPPRWSFIAPTIIEPSCATVNCHSEVAQRAGVDLHDRATGYTDLTTRNFVVPNIPDSWDSSALQYLLNGQGALRMPPDAPLPNVDIALIQEWISLGAMND
jgi:hypothetical protein